MTAKTGRQGPYHGTRFHECPANDIFEMLEGPDPVGVVAEYCDARSIRQAVSEGKYRADINRLVYVAFRRC
jgi:hypothetical protein